MVTNMVTERLQYKNSVTFVFCYQLDHNVRMKTKHLNDMEKKFVDAYLLLGKPYEAAIEAGYSESMAKTKAYTWVSVSKCPDKKRHVLEEIAKRQNERSERTQTDADWLLGRLRLLADFNIKKFLKVSSNGLAYYDFTTATEDDWYCIEEVTTEEIARGQGMDKVEVDKVKIKAVSKIKALELIGRHVAVGAFADKLVVETVDRASIIAKARERAKNARK